MHNGNLSKYLKDFPGSPRIALIHDIVSGLEYLHNQNIVHGDLKAKNVLVSNQGRAILADFGISHVHKTDLTSTKDNSGTYNWMAPEILSSPKPTPESDIWSLGCTCYEALTGKWPFPDLEQTKDVIKALSEVPVIPGKVDQIELEGWPENQQKVWKLVESCWESEPRDRPSALTLRSEIKELDPDAESKPKSNDNDNRTRRMKTKRIDFRRVDSILSQITSPDGATKALNQATDCNGLEKGESYLTNMTNSQSNHPPQPNHPC
ncbi:Serine/threonine-protein kinase sepA [Leucoagaricus sp. SymC.cos]|nr:Serine/threonine-protein kinase sepA [Leucoagaricus sp. SymC.cos]